MNKKSRGFTLIEILIVVVVIGVLASLILPRMLTAPEKAIVAEANQLVGAMVRSELSNLDTGGTWVDISSTIAASEWTKLGMNTPSIGQKKFDYTCSSSGCKASRSGSGSDTNKWVHFNTTGTWSCGSDYRSMSNGGCALL